jgi:sugar phosphate isomerase/epimerase
MAPIGIQLYTVRAELARDFENTIRRIASMGYVGVETAGQYGESPAYAANLFRELGLQVVSMHAPLPLLGNLNQAMEIANTFGVKRVVCAWYPPERLESVNDIRAVCDELNRANETFSASGLELHYHNHWQECALVENKRVYQHMLDALDKNIGFEIDVYWAQTAGVEPAAMIRELGKRAPLLHIKDGLATRQDPKMAVGDGKVDMRAIAEASHDTAEWWIVELDECATDMMQAVEKSINYLTQNHLAYGK